MTISLTELRRLNFADAMYEIVFPDVPEASNQTAAMYEYLWKKIVDQELRPGDRVVDLAIAEEAGVSRTPVREAIQRLVQDGLLERLPRGVRVAVPTPEDTIELYDFRIALETFAARRAAMSMPREEIRQLLSESNALALRLSEPSGQYDPRVAVDATRWDLRLHHLLLRYGGNNYVRRSMAAIQARLSLFQVAGTRVAGHLEMMQHHHRLILDALGSQDAAGAGRSLEDHLEFSKAKVLVNFFGQRNSGNVTPLVERAASDGLSQPLRA